MRPRASPSASTPVADSNSEHLNCRFHRSQHVAVKVIEKKRMRSKPLRRRVVNEIDLLAKCRHARIVAMRVSEPTLPSAAGLILLYF